MDEMKAVRVHTRCAEDIVDWAKVSKHGTVAKGSIEQLSLDALKILNEAETLLASDEARRAHRVAKNHITKGLSILYALGYWPADAEEDCFCSQAFNTPSSSF